MSRFLVSFCNNAPYARLAVVGTGGIERIVELDASPQGQRNIGVTGFCRQDEHWHVCLQGPTGLICTLDRDFRLVRMAHHPELRDLHGIIGFRDRLFVASTGTDQICSLATPSLGDLRAEWSLSALAIDTAHVNDLAVVDDRLFASSLGTRTREQVRSGSVLDVAAARILLSGPREPHSLQHWNGRLYLLESATGDLIEWREGFEPRRRLGIIGYARGLAFTERLIAIGRSGYRDASRLMLGDRRQAPVTAPMPAELLDRSGVCFATHDGRAAGFIDTTAIGREIYQIVAISD